jgi:hypothetical protein
MNVRCSARLESVPWIERPFRQCAVRRDHSRFSFESFQHQEVVGASRRGLEPLLTLVPYLHFLVPSTRTVILPRGNQEEAMSAASGLVIETPTAELPFKAVISNDGETIQEKYFHTREEAEVYLVDTLRGLNDLGDEEGDLN